MDETAPPNSGLPSRRQFLIGLGAIGTFAFSEAYTPRRSAPVISEKAFQALVPMQLGGWRYLTESGLILPPQDQLSQTLYEQLLTRIYQTERHEAVMLLLAYSSIQEGRLQVHRPEICYPAAGFRIVSNTPLDIPVNAGLTISGRYLVAERADRQECIFYWTRVGHEMPIRWFDQRLAMAKANLAGYLPDGLLGRVSVISSDVDAARKVLEQFIAVMAGSLNAKGLRVLVTGREAA